MFGIETTTQIIRMVMAFAGVMLFFALSYMGFQRLFFKILIVIIPFQFFLTRLGSLNMGMTYVLGMSMILNRSWIKKQVKGPPPLLLSFIILSLAFLFSFAFAPRMFWSKNEFYLVMLVSNVILFYMSYYFISEEKDILTLVRLLFLCNLLVIGHCLVQFSVGPSDFQLFGIQDFSFQKNRTNRIVGPFKAAGIMAEYLLIQCLLLSYHVMKFRRYRKFAISLIFSNIALLIGTGNRGGFICFFIAFILFVFYFRRRLGVVKIVVMSSVMFIMMILASYLMIKYTDFNVIYERVLGTRMDGIVPDTRGGWLFTLEAIGEKPILGHGPRLISPDEFDPPLRLPKGAIGSYPHNLYLFLLYTMGIVGLLAYVILWKNYFTILKKTIRRVRQDSFESEFARLGVIILIVFLIDQIKVEFLRFYFLDYQHYLSVVFGMFCGLRNLSGNNMTKDNIIQH